MVNIAGVDSFNYQNLIEESEGERQDQLDKHDFLRLLITQLEYQDPMQPMDNTEFVAQMAQFSSLEQMHNMNESISEFMEFSRLGEASSLLGKRVELYTGETGGYKEGTVEGVLLVDNKVYLEVENEKYRPDQIVRILSENN